MMGWKGRLVCMGGPLALLVTRLLIKQSFVYRSSQSISQHIQESRVSFKKT